MRTGGVVGGGCERKSLEEAREKSIKVGGKNEGRLAGGVGGWVGVKNVYVRNAPRPQQEDYVKIELEERMRANIVYRGDWWKQQCKNNKGEERK